MVFTIVISEGESSTFWEIVIAVMDLLCLAFLGSARTISFRGLFVGL